MPRFNFQEIDPGGLICNRYPAVPIENTQELAGHIKKTDPARGRTIHCYDPDLIQRRIGYHVKHTCMSIFCSAGNRHGKEPDMINVPAFMGGIIPVTDE